jgi:phage protein D
MAQPGIRLELLIGPTLPKPAPIEVLESLIELEVNQQDRDRSGFQMTFSLGKNFKKSFKDYQLLLDGVFDPPNRVIITVIIGFQRFILIDGIITFNQVVPSNQPGESRLIVTGEDISLKLDLEDKNATYPNLSDSEIVAEILAIYEPYIKERIVTDNQYQPAANKYITTQHETDLEFIQRLAQRNGFIFEITPSQKPGENKAYWGEEQKNMASVQPALSMNMGALTNVDYPITFSFNALTPTEVLSANITNSSNPLAKKPATPLRKTILRDSDKFDNILAQKQANSIASDSKEEAVTASGEVNTLRYGHVLQVRRLVELRGVGDSYNGRYYVKQVIHRMQRGQYIQSFTLIREGRGTKVQKVTI